MAGAGVLNIKPSVAPRGHSSLRADLCDDRGHRWPPAGSRKIDTPGEAEDREEERAIHRRQDAMVMAKGL